MLKEKKILIPVTAAEIPEIVAAVFGSDFTEYIFGSSFDPVGFLEDYFALLCDQSRPPKNFLFKVCVSDRLAGLVWFEQISWMHRNLVLTIYFLTEFRQKNLGAKAFYHAAYWAFCFFNMKKIKCFVYQNNSQMIRMLKKIGAHYEGKIRGFRIYQGCYQDLEIFALTDWDFRHSPKIAQGRQIWEN